MNFYDRWILPPILDLITLQYQLEKYRSEVVAPVVIEDIQKKWRARLKAEQND